jgi:hypothetical protein
MINPGNFMAISRSAKSQLTNANSQLERVESAANLMMQGLSIGKATNIGGGQSSFAN